MNALLLCCASLAAQQSSLSGAIDFHAHVDPDSVPRSVDAVDLARLAKKEGMRAIVIKNHFVETATAAYFARKAVPGMDVFGGIDLNLTVGGMNPAAVENMAKIAGHYGRVVWMTSFDSQEQVRSAKENRPFVPVSRNGQLLPEGKSVIAMIAKYNLVMETGHNTSQVVLMLIREGKRQGVKHIVVTHAMMAPIHMNISQMKEAASMGAYIEFVHNGLIGSYKEFTSENYAKAMHAVGAEHCIVASDMGQATNPVHTEALKIFYDGLLKAGVTQNELDLMARQNPKALLDLN